MIIKIDNKKAQLDTELVLYSLRKAKLEFTYSGTKYPLCYER